MLRERRRNGSVVIYRVFLAAMIAAVVLFLMRVASGKLETDFSVGQVIHLRHGKESFYTTSFQTEPVRFCPTTVALFQS